MIFQESLLEGNTMYTRTAPKRKGDCLIWNKPCVHLFGLSFVIFWSMDNILSTWDTCIVLWGPGEFSRAIFGPRGSFCLSLLSLIAYHNPRERDRKKQVVRVGLGPKMCSLRTGTDYILWLLYATILLTFKI